MARARARALRAPARPRAVALMRTVCLVLMGHAAGWPACCGSGIRTCAGGSVSSRPAAAAVAAAAGSLRGLSCLVPRGYCAAVGTDADGHATQAGKKEKNAHNVCRDIRVEKLVLNIAVGESGDRLTKAARVLEALTDQKPVYSKGACVRVHVRMRCVR